jgi:hypothetical protein
MHPLREREDTSGIPAVSRVRDGFQAGNPAHVGGHARPLTGFFPWRSGLSPPGASGARSDLEAPGETGCGPLWTMAGCLPGPVARDTTSMAARQGVQTAH